MTPKPSRPAPHDSSLRAAANLDCFDLGDPGGAPGWHPLAAALDDQWLAAQLDRLIDGNGHGRRPRAVAGAYLASGLSWAVSVPVTALLVTQRQVIDTEAGNLSIHVDDYGWPTRMAIHQPRVTALPTDPAATQPAVTVTTGMPELVELAAAQLVATFTPIFAAIRRASPYGTSGMWGTLADNVASTLWLLRDRGATAAELDDGWQLAQALIDALQTRRPGLRSTPRRFRFADASPPADLPMRGTCCLYYRTPEAAADGGDGMCNTCPRRRDDERVALVNRWFASGQE
jgi:Ferric iron reductase FhuF-like transporter/FhuF 2Fe-2S C-terminal domain